ncbi:MAG: sn-glycerol-1-phosphate dehydrogenase [Gammaproteobacteria bacterium]|nr:MAG: sn-glycerol-1-phosphate dehydrogenase [Gammaproteobacteria bacterium]
MALSARQIVSSGDIERLLGGQYVDPDGGELLAVATRSVVIANSLAGMEGELVAALGIGRRLAVVSDATTHQVLGARVVQALRAMASVQDLVLPEHPHADAHTAAELRTTTRACDALIAVGAGTINDLCKVVAAEDGKPYAVFGTAPSMNGYTSTSAAITVDGHKRSLPARAPAGVFLDLRILTRAPPRMIRSGLGDSLCRSTAQADWLLARLLREEPYREVPFVLLAQDEEALLGEPEALLGGDLEAMRCLARTLVLSGFGMAICGGSYPASQGEHLISHYADMMGDRAWPESFHGEQIGVTTLTMARLQAQLLDQDRPPRLGEGPHEADVVGHFGGSLGRSCWREFCAKRSSAAQRALLNERLEQQWPQMRRRIAAVMVPAAKLEAALERAGAATTPQEIHWPRDFYQNAVRHAREIRDRYTFLDLAGDGDRLERFVRSL